MSTDNSDEQVALLLAKIEEEKKRPNPDKSQMRKWFYEIVRLKEDYRVVHNADGCHTQFHSHTSMRTFEDDYDRRGPL